MKKGSIVLGILMILVSSLFAQLTSDIPREETIIVDVLGGRVPSPSNFNVFRGTPGRGLDRGIQQLMLEPLWCVDFATGEIINALASEGPTYN